MTAFSPLFIGAVSATFVPTLLLPPIHPFSPLFIGSVSATTLLLQVQAQMTSHFQSPFHRGSECNLFFNSVRNGNNGNFQSPFHRGSECNNEAESSEEIGKQTFSPLFIGAVSATSH